MLTTALIKIPVFRGVMLCPPVYSCQSLGGIVRSPSSPRSVAGLTDIGYGLTRFFQNVGKFLPWLSWKAADISTRTSGLDPGLSHVGFEVDKVTLGQDSLRVLTIISGQYSSTCDQSPSISSMLLETKDKEIRLGSPKEEILFRIMNCVKVEKYFQLSSFSCRPAAARVRSLASPFSFCGEKK